MVPGQVIEADTIGFMRKLDVKEIHGYNNARGLKLIKLAAIGKAQKGAAGSAKQNKAPPLAAAKATTRQGKPSSRCRKLFAPVANEPAANTDANPNCRLD
jgi:hypothetical protein